MLNSLASSWQLHESGTAYFGVWNLLIRYITFLGMGILLWTARRNVLVYLKEPVLLHAWMLSIHVCVLGALSAEYLQWAKASGASTQYKLGLTVLWGVYALVLIIYGIWKMVRYLRLAAIILFGITLIKLFFYDLAGASTITKTVSFISLGVILLLVSYLYNRYKEKLFS